MSPGGFLYDEPGFYVDILETDIGCDSLVGIYLSLPSFDLSFELGNYIPCKGNSKVIIKNDNDADVLEYSKDGVSFQDSNIFTNLVGGDYTFVVKDELGCVEELEVEVENVDLNLPNICTPNGDGVNEVFSNKNTKSLLELSFSVFNRWGKLVFETFDKEINWYGDNCSDGIYYYYVNSVSDEYETCEVKGVVQIAK